MESLRLLLIHPIDIWSCLEDTILVSRIRWLLLRHIRVLIVSIWSAVRIVWSVVLLTLLCTYHMKVKDDILFDELLNRDVLVIALVDGGNFLVCCVS
jgi:hypothetical protein